MLSYNFIVDILLSVCNPIYISIILKKEIINVNITFSKNYNLSSSYRCINFLDHFESKSFDGLTIAILGEKVFKSKSNIRAVFTDELGIAMAESGVEAMTCNHALALRKKYLSR